MLVRLVSAVLQRFLGQYVENLDTERLSYSLGYFGNVVLTDLHLKPDALRHLLGLPLHLKSGTIACVHLAIPLTRLRSQPWCITIEDAELVVCPSNRSVVGTRYSSDTVDNSSKDTDDFDESRKAYLDRLESRWWQVVQEGGLVDAVATTSPSDSSWWSYGVSLAYGIVSNLQVEIRNINFTFLDEDELIEGHLVWGLRLERITIQATDENWNPSGRSQNQQIECKSIDIVGFCIYYGEGEKFDQHYIIPPSQFAVHLLRRTTPEPLTSESLPRIEVDAKLATLEVNVSRSLLVYLRQLVEFLKRQSPPPRRPPHGPSKQPALWWRYAANEVVSAWRNQRWPYRPPDQALKQLAEAAILTNRYVHAYEAHLLQGLGLDDSNAIKAENHEILEENMSLDRVVLLRQVVMQRVAKMLKQQRPFLTRAKNQPVVTGQRSQSWWPSFLNSAASGKINEDEGLTKAGVEEEDDEAPRPWRLWWWFSAHPAAASTKETATSTATSAEAALMLLNELVAARDVALVLTRDRLFCRITCCVGRFRLTLEEDVQSLCSLCADNLHLCVETRPREEVLHFAARLRSLVVRDERCRSGRRRPLFPTVISPFLHDSSSAPSDLFYLDYTSTQLADELSSPPSSLTIRTDPLRVVCQPELFNRVARFFVCPTANSSNNIWDDVNAYDTIKSQTKANLRAALHNVEMVDENATAEPPTPFVGADLPLRPAVKLPPLASHSLRLHLDIAAPRILLPERLWSSQEEAGDGTLCPPANLLGVICDFGRFRLSNWEPPTSSTEECGSTVTVPVPSGRQKRENSIYDDDESEDSDVFATPCGSPVPSDSESQQTTSQQDCRSLRRGPLPKYSRHCRRLYETYLLELDEFRILAGRLDELQVSGLWPNLLPNRSSSITEDGRHITQVTSQVNLVDRFSLAIWITRRVVPMAYLRSPSTTNLSLFPSPPPTIPPDLPGLLICLEQRHCVFRLSDARVSAVRRCLAAAASAAGQELDETKGHFAPPSPPPVPLSQNGEIRRRRRSKCSIQLSPKASVTSELRRTIVVTFNMYELILQLDTRGRPLAECRLASTAARFTRSTDTSHLTTIYEVNLQVHSLTIADALCGLGGDFDLLAASHRDVRLDTLSGNLSITGSNSAKRSSRQQSIGDNVGGFVVTRPFFDPIGDDDGDACEDSSTALIRVKYFQSSSMMKTARRVDVRFRHLDLLGNLNTLVELIAFVRCVVPTSESRAKSSNTLSTVTNSTLTIDKKDGNRNDDSYNNDDSLEMSVSVERLSLVLIRLKMAPKAEGELEERDGPIEEIQEEECSFFRPVATAERLATITLLGARFQSQNCHNDLRVSLAGLQILDLMEAEPTKTPQCSPVMQSVVQHRHIFVAGRCLDPELPGSMLTSTWAKSVFSLVALRHNSSGYHVELEVSSPVYVHKPRALHEISAWFSRLYHRNAGVGVLARRLAKSAVAVAAAPLQQQPAPQTSSLHLASIRVVLDRPVVVLPAGPTSSHVLIARLGRLTHHIGDDVDGADCEDASAPLRLIQISISQASLSALDVADERRVPKVRGASEAVQAMLVIAHYLHLVPSPGEHHVLEDISADIMVKRQTFFKPQEEFNGSKFNWPEDFDSKALNFAFADDNRKVEASEKIATKTATWITVSACLTQPLHVKLSKSVYRQVLQTLDNLTYPEEKAAGDGESAGTPTMTIHEGINAENDHNIGERVTTAKAPGLAIRFRIPQLVVETFTEMGGEAHPLGLTRLSLREFFVAASRIPSSLGGGVTHLEATLASLLLENLLPDYQEEDRYLLYSHYPPLQSQQSSQSRSHRWPRHPLAASCPCLIESSDWITLPDQFLAPMGGYSKSLQRPPLKKLCDLGRSVEEANNFWSRNRSRSHSSIEVEQLCRPDKERSKSEGDHFFRIRLLFVDRNFPLFTTKYNSVHRYMDVSFSSLTCHLSLHPWVLLLDFLDLSSPITACDEFDIPMTATRTSSSSTLTQHTLLDDGKLQPGQSEETETEAVTVTTLSVSTFSFLVDIVRDSRLAPPLLRASASRLKLRLTSHSRSIKAGGDWFHLAGRVASASIYDLTPLGRRFYPRRFLTVCRDNDDGGSDYLVFTLTKYQLPDPEVARRTEDGVLALRIGPAYYVHTQTFLATAIDSLNKFLQYQDLMNRVRASSEGYKVRQGAPISMRLRLNVKAEAPILVLPPFVTSQSVLICNLGTLTAVNTFCWHKDVLDGEGNSDPLEDLTMQDKNQACKYCLSDLWWCDRPSEVDSKDIMTQSFYPTVALETSQCGNDDDARPCLLDRIHLNLSHIEVYIGKRHSITDATRMECSAALQFGEFCILPEAEVLTKPFGLSVTVERNLCAGRGQHSAPDWRLSARLRLTSPLRLSLQNYTLLRSVLTHNISESPPLAAPIGVTTNSGLNTSMCTIANPSHKHGEPVYTRRPYKVMAFTFELEDVAICLSVPPDWPSQSHLSTTPVDTVDAPFCRLDLTRSRLSYDSFSCGRHITDLACTAVTFSDLRFEGSPKPLNLYPTILSALSSPPSSKQDGTTIPSPQFRVVEVVTPVDGDGITTSQSNNSRMTFHLRSMRLILTLDWLVDLHRFLTTPPISPSPLPTAHNRVEGGAPAHGEAIRLQQSLTGEASYPQERQKQNEKPVQGTSDLRVFSDQTEFVIIEDPSQIDSNIVVLTGAMRFLLRSGGKFSQSPMHLCLHEVGLHTSQGFTEHSRAVIVEPTDITVTLTPPSRKGDSNRYPSSPRGGLHDLVVPRGNLELWTSTIRTHLSYTDSLLFLALLDSFKEQASHAFGYSKSSPKSSVSSIQSFSPSTFDPSIDKLVEMGFSAEAAAQALPNTNGRVDEAIVALTEPQPPTMSPTSTTSPQSRLVCFLRSLVDFLTPRVSDISFESGFSLCLIDDCMDADVPIAEILISDISLEWNLTGWTIGRVIGHLAANYYNRDLSALEPAVEPFLCVCDWCLRTDDSSGGDCAIIEVHSPDTINVNLTVALVRLIQLVNQKTQSEPLAHQLHSPRRRLRAPFVPFCLSNQTGEMLHFRKAVATNTASFYPYPYDEDEWTQVDAGTCVELPFQSALAATGRSQSPSRGNTRGSPNPLVMTPSLILKVNGWMPTYPVALDRLGLFTRTIRSHHKIGALTSGHPLSSVTRLVIEIVRRGSAQNLVIVRSGLTITNRLSPLLSLEVGLACGPLSTSTSSSFTGSSVTTTTYVRSGMHVAFGETRALPLSLAARGSGGERLCFRPVFVTSRGTDHTDLETLFDWSQQLCPTHGNSGGGLRLATSPEEVMDWRRLTKSGDFDECVMSCRHLKSGSEIGLYSATTASPKRLTMGHLQKQSRWQFCVTAVRDSFSPDPVFREASLVLPGHHLTVGPVLRVVNLLPCELTFFLKDVPLYGHILPNKAASVFEINCSNVLRFGVLLDNFQRCEPIHLPPATFSDTVLINLFDHYGRLLQLQAVVHSRAFGARHITISAVCWLINHSGLPLVFASQAPSSLACFAEWKTPGSPEHRSLAAGQSREQEVARLASPLLFSPATTADLSSTAVIGAGDGDSGGGGASNNTISPPSWSLQVRLGALYEPSEGGGGGNDQWIPRWSAPVALSKTEEALMLRLKAVTAPSRPDLLYSVGVEVRKGAGLHSATTIVTFVPRFLVSNQTDFQLQVAQRFYLNSTACKPVDIQSHCNVPFHWPRQDLDQLLCFRALIPDQTWPSGPNTASTPVPTHWSGSVQIDKPRSYHLMLRMPTRSQTAPPTSVSSPVEPLFLRVDVILRGATLFVIVSDATYLPPPFRIRNLSPVALFYQQFVDSGGSDALQPPHPVSNANNGWSGGIFLNRLPPRSIVNYAPEEPLLPPLISVGVHGDLSNVYDLSKVGAGSRLIYNNCVYLAICGVAGDDNQIFPDSRTEYTPTTLTFPVFDVITESEKVRRVVLRKKRPGERSQLWYLSSQGFVVHEGSSAPQAPLRRRGRLLSKKHSWVLDVDTSEATVAEAMTRCLVDPCILENFEVGILCLARLASRRKNTQTWRFDRSFLINAASFCVQSRRSCNKKNPSTSEAIFVARPKFRGITHAEKVRGGIPSLVNESLGVAHVLRNWLRPGSGSLQVEMLTEGPVRVLQISDPQEPNPPIPTSFPFQLSHFTVSPTSFRFLLDLNAGIGVSVISTRCEELCYATLSGLRFALKRFYPGLNGPRRSPIDVGREVTESEEVEENDAVFVDFPDQSRIDDHVADGEIGDAFAMGNRPMELVFLHIRRIQVDNQIAGASLPILLFRAASNESFLSATPPTKKKTSKTGVLEGRLLSTSSGSEWIQGRELENLLHARRNSAGLPTKSNETNTSLPNLVMRSQRLLHTGWKAKIFTLLEVKIDRMVVQAEELLLLKLIQFSRHFQTSTPVPVTSVDDAKSIDFLDRALLEAEGTYTRNVLPPSIPSHGFLYFDRLRVLLAPVRVTVHTAEGRLGPEFYDVHRLLPKIMSFSDADLRLCEFVLEHCLESRHFLMEQLVRHFQAQIRAQALRIFGSVDLLGNPLGFVSDISSGISDLADMDLSGLVRNVAHGVGDSTAKVVGSMSQLLHTLSMDEQYQRRRRAIMVSPQRVAASFASSSSSSSYNVRSRVPESVTEERLDEFEATIMFPSLVTEAPEVSGRNKGLFAQTAPLRAGLRGFVHGVVGGVTSMVTQPIHGAREEDSLKGFVYGVGRGLLGTVTKPVGGVLDLVSGAMTSLREAARPSSSGRPRRMRPRRALYSPLRAYSLTEAVGQLLLCRLCAYHTAFYDRFPTITASVDDLNYSEGISMSHLLKASGQQWEEDGFEMVIRVLRCQSNAVSVIVTDRAIWCVRNFNLQVVKRTSTSTFSEERSDATGIMFVIPYFYLNGVRLYRHIPNQDTLIGPRGVAPPSSTGAATESSYIEFRLERGCRELRFDQAEWAQEALAEVSEAHFRFVQRMMELRRDRPVDLALRIHPSALPFAPPLLSAVGSSPLDGGDNDNE